MCTHRGGWILESIYILFISSPKWYIARLSLASRYPNQYECCNNYTQILLPTNPREDFFERIPGTGQHQSDSWQHQSPFPPAVHVHEDSDIPTSLSTVVIFHLSNFACLLGDVSCLSSLSHHCFLCSLVMWLSSAINRLVVSFVDFILELLLFLCWYESVSCMLRH